MNRTFLGRSEPIITSMVQGVAPDSIKKLMCRSVAAGADAVGVQLCRLKQEYKTEAVLLELFDTPNDVPVYFTDYRLHENAGKTDSQLGEEVLLAVRAGGTLADIMGDMYCKSENEMTFDRDAIKRQKDLIADIHGSGGEVLMSSHVCKFMGGEQVLEIAYAQQERGADIVKIVTASNSKEELAENLKTTLLLKEKLCSPFLFLSVGKFCRLHRLAGRYFGCCTALSVCEYDEYATKAQPLISDTKFFDEIMNNTEE